ncbi:MAG: hypothetical protein O6757_08690, partial [Alphaproteobacteria bacterium]|nr:hypothetical protein [Alphaproteobacteria bacterium]
VQVQWPTGSPTRLSQSPRRWPRAATEKLHGTAYRFNHLVKPFQGNLHQPRILWKGDELHL